MTTPPPYDLCADDFRDYRLPPSIAGNVPPALCLGEPGTHWLARGLTVETTARLLARPVAVEVTEQEHLTVISAVISLASAVWSTDPLGDLLSADLILVPRTRRWALIVQDRMTATGLNVPSPRYLADLVHEAYDARRRPAPDTCRGPATPPSHLW
jgi:hypothetical protein